MLGNLNSTKETLQPVSPMTLKDDATLTKIFEGKNSVSSLLEASVPEFLYELQFLAESKNSMPDIIEDIKAVKKWLGVRKKAISSQQHAKFAAAFEPYFLKGKASPVGLEKVFPRLRSWLLEVYKAGELVETEVSHAVEIVLERMIMADQAVNLAASELGLEAIDCNDMLVLGMEQESGARYNELVLRGRDTAARTMFVAMEQAVRRKTPRWRREAVEAVESNPMHVIVDDLRKGRGLDRLWVHNLWGEESVNGLPESIVKQGGLHPDAVAMQAGFTSAKGLCRALMAYHSPKEQTADYISQKTIQSDSTFEAVDFILQTAELSRCLALLAEQSRKIVMQEGDGKQHGNTEAKSTGEEELSRYAKQILGQKTVSDATRVEFFVGAIKKAAAKKNISLNIQNPHSFFMANEQMRLHCLLARESKKIKNFIEERVEKNAFRTLLQDEQISRGYKKALSSLVQRFGFIGEAVSRASNKRHLTPLLKKSATSSPGVTIFEDWLLDESNSCSYMLLSVEKFYQLNELLDLLYGLGKQEKERAFSAIGKKKEVVGKKLDAILEKREAPCELKTAPLWNIVCHNYRDILTNVDTLLFALRHLDNGTNLDGKGQKGPFETYIHGTLAQGFAHHKKMKKSIYAAIEQALIQFENCAIRLNASGALNGLPVPRSFMLLGYDHWSCESVLSLALNRGCVDNWLKVLEGHGLSPQEGEEILSVLMDADWNAVQQIWDALEELWKQQTKVSKQVWFFTPSEVEAQAFITASGKPLRGGVYPLAFESSVHATAQTADGPFEYVAQQINTRWQQYKSMNIPPQEALEPVQLSFSVLAEHLDQSLCFISYAEPVYHVLGILRDNDLRIKIEDAIGVTGYQMLLDVLQSPSGGKIDLYHRLNDWSTRVGSIIPKYFFSQPGKKHGPQLFSPSIFEKIFLKENARTYENGLGAVLQFGSFGEANKGMLELSSFAKLRHASIKKSIGAATASFFAESKKGEAARNGVASFAHFADSLVVVPLWWGAYWEGLQQFGGDIAQSILYADDILKTCPDIGPLFNGQSVRGRQKSLARFFGIISSLHASIDKKSKQSLAIYPDTGEAGSKIPCEEGDLFGTSFIMLSLFRLVYRAKSQKNYLCFDQQLYQLCGFPFAQKIGATLSGVTQQSISAGKQQLREVLPMCSRAYGFFDGLQSMVEMLYDLECDDALGQGVLALTEMATAPVGMKETFQHAQHTMHQFEQFEKDGIIPEYLENA